MGSSSAAADEFNFPKIELHLHLDGAVRHSTIFELAKKKKIDLHGAKSVEDVKKLLVTHQPANLAKVLAAFDIFIPVIKNDASALERIAYETCEDQSKAGVIYFEGRYR
uniref:adenosine deaminase n=1 Tax=Panagrolaimus davidi TaxID=227884 RepID=A0A914P9Q6_9BILA